MKERPILFSAPMVRAILDGRKTQTRRIVKPQPDIVADGGSVVGVFTPEDQKYGRLGKALSCPYGQPGDRLWVRETWRDWSESAWHYAADGTVIPKQRDRDLAAFLAQRAPFTWESYSWRPSIHMPRAASRITLEIIEIRVERLQDVSEADALAEGLKRITKDGGTTIKHGIPDRDGLPGTDDTGWPWRDWNADPRVAFRRLWESINGADSWAANPWAWVVGFRRVTP